MSVDADVAEVSSSAISVVSSLLTSGGASEEVLDSSGKGVEIDASVLLEYSVERVINASDVDVPFVVTVSGIMGGVSGISLWVGVENVSVSVSVVVVTSLEVVVTSDGMDAVKTEVEDNVEGTSVDIVLVKPEEVISGRSVVTVSPVDMVNLEDNDVISEVDVTECVYVIDSDINGDVCEEGTKYVDTSEVIFVASVESVISVVGPVGVTIGHVAFAVTNVEGTSVMTDGGDSVLIEGSKVVRDGRM